MWGVGFRVSSLGLGANFSQEFDKWHPGGGSPRCLIPFEGEGRSPLPPDSALWRNPNFLKAVEAANGKVVRDPTTLRIPHRKRSKPPTAPSGPPAPPAPPALKKARTAEGGAGGEGLGGGGGKEVEVRSWCVESEEEKRRKWVNPEGREVEEGGRGEDVCRVGSKL